MNVYTLEIASWTSLHWGSSLCGYSLVTSSDLSQLLHSAINLEEFHYNITADLSKSRGKHVPGTHCEVPFTLVNPTT